jgi:hypothetical protein
VGEGRSISVATSGTVAHKVNIQKYQWKNHQMKGAVATKTECKTTASKRNWTHISMKKGKVNENVWK